MGGWAAPSPYTGNTLCSHPCCRWDRRQLGKSPLTDLNQLIRITNYTLSHTRMLRWWWLINGAVALPAVFLNDVVCPDCIYTPQTILPLISLLLTRILLFLSSHFFFSSSHSFSGVILYPPVGLCQLVTWREISGVTAKWIFHCNRLKSILASIETHQQGVDCNFCLMKLDFK